MKTAIIMGCGSLGQYAIKTWPTTLKIHAISRSLPALHNQSHITWHRQNLQSSSLLESHNPLAHILASSPWINFWLPPHTKDYLQILKSIVDNLGAHTLFTFVSSTSIFGLQEKLILEDTLPDPQSENAQLLVDAETYIKNTLRRYHIIRLAGLVDEIRHPVYFLDKKSPLQDGHVGVNLIHSFDAVSFIYHLANSKKFKRQNIITNLACSTHLPKNVFYKKIALSKNISAPDYTNQEYCQIFSKNIACNYLWSKYRYQLKYLHVC